MIVYTPKLDIPCSERPSGGKGDPMCCIARRRVRPKCSIATVAEVWEIDTFQTGTSQLNGDNEDTLILSSISNEQRHENAFETPAISLYRHGYRYSRQYGHPAGVFRDHVAFSFYTRLQ